MDGLTVARNIHYVTDEGIHLAALVTKVWNKDAGLINLSAFIDNSVYTGDPVMMVTSVNYSDEPLPNTWHWIERA